MISFIENLLDIWETLRHIIILPFKVVYRTLKKKDIYPAR